MGVIIITELIKTFLIGIFFGTFGTTIGGLIGVNLKSNSNKFLGFILSFASGLMMSIICFDLIPEAMEIANLAVILLGILLGILTMIICDTLVKEKFSDKKGMNSLLRTGNNKYWFSASQYTRRTSDRNRISGFYKFRIIISYSNCNT